MKPYKITATILAVFACFDIILGIGHMYAGEPPTSVPSQELSTIAEVQKIVKLLESEGRSKEATEVYRRAFIRSSGLDFLQGWIDLDSERFQKCKPNNKVNQLTEYTPPSAYVDALKATVLDGTNTIFQIPFPIMSNPIALYNFEKKRKEIVETERKKPLRFFDEKTTKKTIEEYETIRASLKLSQQAIQKSLVVAKQPILGDLIAIGKKHEAFVKNVAEARCQYVSFDVLSPRFARCRQLVFLSGNSNTLGLSYSMEELKEAAKILGSDRELVFECNHEVRSQFLSLLKEIKGLAGKSAFEELEVTGGLLGGKDLGADRWLK